MQLTELKVKIKEIENEIKRSVGCSARVMIQLDASDMSVCVVTPLYGVDDSAVEKIRNVISGLLCNVRHTYTHTATDRLVIWYRAEPP